MMFPFICWGVGFTHGAAVVEGIADFLGMRTGTVAVFMQAKSL